MVRDGEPESKKRRSEIKVCPEGEMTLTKERAIFNSMDYMESSPDSDGPVKAWIVAQPLGDFISNKMVLGGESLEVKSMSGGGLLAQLQVSKDPAPALASARSALQSWGSSNFDRSKALYSVTREVQKQGKLLALTEAISTGVHLRDCKEAVATLVAALYHYTGAAQLSSESSKPHGVLSVLLPPANTLTALARHAAPALAAGNTLILSPCPSAVLPALLFAQICATAGLPAGVVSVLGSAGSSLNSGEGVDMVCGVLWRADRLEALGSGLRRTLPVRVTLPTKSTMVVFANSDVDTAAQTLLDKAFVASGQSSASIGKVLVQSPVYGRFCNILRERVARLVTGSPLDGCTDVGTTLCKEGVPRVLTGNSHLTYVTSESKGDALPCTVVFGVQPSSDLWESKVRGPLLSVTEFRTAKEATALVNHSTRNSGVSLWTEKNSLIMQLVKQLNSEVVWVNCHGSGGSLNGMETLRNFTKARSGVFEAPTPRKDAPLPSMTPVQGQSVNETVKMLIGGALKRSSGDTYRTVYSSSGEKLGSVPDANKKDMRDAVEAAAKAQPGWSGKTPFNRSQILYFLAENLSARKAEFLTLVQESRPSANAEQEVEESIRVLFECAGRADKLGSHVTPLGVVGVVPSSDRLFDMMRLVAGAVVSGNSVILVPTELSSLLAAHLAQVISVSDIPGGVINILYGSQASLGQAMAQHPVIAGLWFPSTVEGALSVQREAVITNKAIWMDECAETNGVIRRCLFSKTVVMPAGDSFAN